MRRWVLLCLMWAVSGVIRAQDAPLPLYTLPDASQYPVYTANDIYVRRNGNLIVINPFTQTVLQIDPVTQTILEEIDAPEGQTVQLSDDTPLLIQGGHFWVLADPQISNRATAINPMTQALWGDFLYEIDAQQPARVAFRYVPNVGVQSFLGEALHTGDSVTALALDTNKRYGYVAGLWHTDATSLDNQFVSYLQVVDLRTGLLVNEAPIYLDVIDQNAHFPTALEFDLNRNRLYVAYGASNRVSVINLRDMIREATFDTGSFPQDMALSRDGLWLYIYNAIDQSIMVRDTQYFGLASTFSITTQPFDADIQLGMELYHSASNEKMSWNNAMSCNTCHGSVFDPQPLNETDPIDPEFLQAHIRDVQGGSGLDTLEITALIHYLQWRRN